VLFTIFDKSQITIVVKKYFNVMKKEERIEEEGLRNNDVMYS